MKNIFAVILLSTTAAIAQPASQPRMHYEIRVPGGTQLPVSGNVNGTLIKHARVYTVGAAGTLPDGDVLIRNGKIEQVGQNLPVTPETKVIDAKGKPVTPGLMASWTQLGILEIDLVSEGNDTTPNTAFEGAAFDVADAVNPSSSLIPVARIRGVTRSLTTPGDCGDVFCGTSAVIDLGNGPDLIDKRQAGVLAVLEPVGGTGQKNSRPDLWTKFRETLDDAREYWAQRGGYHRPGGSRDQRSNRVDLDALGPVIQGREPLLVHVERASTIRQVVQYAQGNKIKLIILGGAEAWRVAGDLAAAHVPVVIDNNKNLPANFAELGSTLKNAARLDAAGVSVIFMPQFGAASHYARTITQIAGNAVANGMNWEHALAAITKNPAQALGIDGYGTLEPGKDGDVVIWDGDPLDVTSAPTAVFIKGVQMPRTSRQTELRDRYRDLGKHAPSLGYR
ncbi:MAG: amidohydrolase family protein [Alphaproteobacteria bacterium]|nr:amidohydrolase family protein [Alphaproteobacteria bacterium]